MGGFAFLAIFIGAITLVALFLIVRQLEQGGKQRNMSSKANEPTNNEDTTTAVLMLSEHGQILHINAVGVKWLGEDADLIDIENIASQTQPSENFYRLLQGNAQTSFKLGQRWLTGMSYTVPFENSYRVMVNLRDATLNPFSEALGTTLDVSLAMQVISQINEVQTTSLSIEATSQVLLDIVGRSIPQHAGEICLWNEHKQFLEQKGWVGDSNYLIKIADQGGGYAKGQGLVGWVYENMRPIIVTGNDTVDVRTLTKDLPYTSAIVIPLMTQDNFLGTLAFYSHNANVYNESHIALMDVINKPMVTALYNATLYREQEERITNIARLQELTEQSSQGSNYSRVYQQLNERIAKFVDAEMSGIFLYDQERSILAPQLPFYGLNENIASRISFPLPKGSPQLAIWEDQPYWVSDDLKSEPLAQQLGLQSIIEVSGIRNTALLPMAIGGERIGILAVSNKRGENSFMGADIQNLRVLATQAGIIVENLRLNERERLLDNELVGLQQMTEAMGAINHEGEFFASITQRIARLMRVDICGILLFDTRSRSLNARLPFVGIDSELIKDYAIHITQNSTIEDLWRNSDYWMSNRVATDSLMYEVGLDQLAEQLKMTRTMFGVMSAGGRRIGVLQIANTSDNRDFADNDARLLQIFATQAAAIIENARLYREVQLRAEQADKLRHVAGLASAVMTPDQSFEGVLQGVGEFMDSKIVFINLIDHNTNSLITYPKWVWGTSISEPVVYDLSNQEFKYSVAMSGRSFFSNELLTDKRLLQGYKTSAMRFGLRSSVMVPLQVGDRSLGELGVSNRDNRPYSEEDVVLLSTVASQISAALERLLLYEATGENLRRRMQELDSIARVSNELALTLELNKVLEMIRQEVKNTLQADEATIALLRPADTWRVADEPEFDRRIGIENLQELTPIEREAIQRGVDPVLITDYQDSPIKSMPTSARSAIAVAILYVDQIVGVIHAYSITPARFDERSAGFILTISTKAALGYQNASYYQQQLERNESLRQRVDQLNRIFELGQMLQSTTDNESLLEAVAYSVQQSVGYDTVLMCLVDETNGVLRRVAQAGMPIDRFNQSKRNTTSLETLMQFLKPEYRVGESFFFPAEQASKWYIKGTEALETAFPDNRSILPKGKDYWHNGDMLAVQISGQGGNLLGMMLLDRPYNNKRPDRSRIEVLEIFAHQAATMIENTRLFLESQRSAEQEAQLNNIMNSVASTLDLNDMALAIAKGLKQFVPFNRITLAISNEQNSNFDYLRVIVLPDGKLHATQETRTSLDRTALGEAYQKRHIATYTSNDTYVKNLDDLKAWYKQGEKSTLILPLIAGGECLGVMHLGSDIEDSMNAFEVRTNVERVAQLVAGSLQNARLFNQTMNLQVLNRSVVESIQQGIVVLDNSGRIINYNDFMEKAYGWQKVALRQDLFAYQPLFKDVLQTELRAVLENGEQNQILGFTSQDQYGDMIVRNLYLYPLRTGETIRGAVLLVDDITERTRLEQSVEMRANQLAALTEVSTRITALLEREDIITLAVEEMEWIIPFDTMSIWRRNGSFMVMEGNRGFQNGVDLLGMRLKISDVERIQTVVDTQRSVSESRTSMSPLGLPNDDEVQSWLGVPLVSQGHVVGMIMLTKNALGFYETREEQHVAFAFASQVAIALANADLFEQTFERTNELGTLLEAAQATSASRDVETVFRTVAEMMFNALEQEHSIIMLWNELDGNVVVEFSLTKNLEAHTQYPKGKYYIVKDYPAKMRCLNQRDVVVVVDGAETQNPIQYKSELEDMRLVQSGTRLLVPLVASDHAIGLIQLDQTSSDELSLTQQKVRLAKALGSQVAVAIENARLSAETNLRFEELMTINSLSQAISSTLSLDDMLPIIREQVPMVTQAEEMYLALYDINREEITFPLAVRNKEDFNIAPRKLGNDEVSYIIKRKRPLSLGADYFSIDELRRSMGITNGEGDVKSYMGVPLISGDQVVGVLAIRSNTKSRAFNVNDDRILTTVGSQLGAAIQNARLFERVTSFADELNDLVEVRTNELEQERDRLDTLYQITSELARTLDMEQLLERALGMVSKAVGAEDGVIMLSDPATDALYCRAWLNPNNIIRRTNAQPTHPAAGFAQWVLLDNMEHVVTVDDLNEQDYWDVEIGRGLRSALAVVLENNEDPIGVIVLLSSQPNMFTETHVKLLVPAANQVAASINSADLYQLIRDQAERLGRLLRTEQEAAQKQGAILEGINDGVILVDSQGNIVMFNPAAERLLGYSRGEVLHQNVNKLMSIFGENSFDWMRFIAELSDSITKKTVQETDGSNRMQVNEYYISTYLTPVKQGDLFLGVLAVFRDVTRDVQAEQTKNQFITNVSHEFRTPLTPIKGFTDLLLMGAGGQLTDQQLSMVETIKQNVERLTVLVNDVLNISKLDTRDITVTMQMVNLNEILPSIVDNVSGRAINVKRNYKHSVTIQPNVPRIRADRERMIQVFTNLVDNAFKYTRAGGTITVDVKLEDDRQHVLVSVKDTGVGIPEEFQDKVWKRFERYDKHALELDVAGTGLGLSLVKELVNLHHGDTWFESKLNVGTTFYVRLPIEQPNYKTGAITGVLNQVATLNNGGND
jgi:PAS domain S-box-containing protein